MKRHPRRGPRPSHRDPVGYRQFAGLPNMRRISLDSRDQAVAAKVDL